MGELRGQLDMFGNVASGNEDYERFTAKFEPKKTTDDCYTPPNVYEAVAEWVCAEYGVKRREIVRPFWPGYDYTAASYAECCCVVDNPPFSIITQIVRFYLARGARFFLFAPTLTLFSGRGNLDVTYIPCGVQITYENGANVNTSFVTNLDTCRVRSAPRLYDAVRRENDANEKAQTKQLPRYKYPDHVLTAAAAYQYSHYGVDYRLEKADCVKIYEMDAQKNRGKKIFGGGFLLSERAAAERAAAERAAAKFWNHSPREHEIQRRLGAADTRRRRSA